MRYSMRIIAAALALATGLTGAAQAENFNIFSASKAQQTVDQGQLEQVRRRHGGHYRHRHFNPGAAFALGTMGIIAGAAAASSYDRRYYCDPYYEYCGRRYYRRGYYAPRYYEPRRYYYYD
ncbi:hypothetical protein IZ6_18540 [Terrihabitans soli]|uniref:BA14K family protein n=1 Tax=Terrihabitans soli TaxID=708113 RepID=A0A6S6QQ14_9HYPH|nr:hypothetical protein [Terrihabitans soli]BCJ91119.1 hypothetical protein IZ6_18540 [Terrihabitans soli]